MDAAASSPLEIAIASVVMLSLAALFYLFQKHVAGHSLLTYQPRRRVPWGGLVALIAMSMPLLAVIAYFANLLNDAPATTADFSTQDFLVMGSVDSLFKILFVFGVMAWLRTFFRAGKHDLGLPTSWGQLFSDIRIGALACIAALLPINAIQITLAYAFESQTLHPLVEQLQKNQSPAILFLSFCMAVIVAPLFEEFTFRGLLQGWLERCEDESLALTAAERPMPILMPEAEVPEAEVTETKIETKTTTANHPTRGWFPPLRHGWLPILISSVAFGLAHLGHGVAPVSLVLFGIVLGYLYQRTHRLAPSITAHLLFNAYSMVLLWLQLQETPPLQ